MNKAVGVFDSGVGGLTVVREILRELPYESIVYFGDTARVPYGTKSAKLVKRYARQDARFLMGFGIKLLVVACNTVSSIGVQDLAPELGIPVVGVIEPACRAAVEATKGKKIGVIGTETTISSGVYEKLIKGLDPEADVTSRPCPLFVPLVEAGWLDDEVTRLTVRRYLTDFKGRIDTLIPGCTHYPLLKRLLEEEIGGEAVIINSAGAVAKRVKEVLEAEGLLSSSGETKEVSYFVSDAPDRFSEMAKLFLGKDTLPVVEIDIEGY